MRQVAEHFPDLCFIQVGANDGVSNDPIREFVVRNRKWNGVFIEPLPSMFALLERNYRYARHPGLHFLQAAISDHMDTATVWKIKDEEYHRYPVAFRGMASFDATHLSKQFPARASEIESHLERVEVPCVTYNSIVRTYQLDRVDLLVVDVEGHEPTIMRDVPLTGPIRPKIVLFEVAHMSLSVEQELREGFEESGYCYRRFGKDAVAVIRSLDGLLG
jgi:FkbM family methyltransferase